MDPNAALTRLRTLLGSPHTADVNEVAEVFEGLDGWLSKGGFTPSEWAAPATAPAVPVLPDDNLVAVIVNRPGEQGAQYTLRLPDGTEATLADGQDGYWELAGILDDLFEDECQHRDVNFRSNPETGADRCNDCGQELAYPALPGEKRTTR